MRHQRGCKWNNYRMNRTSWNSSRTGNPSLGGNSQLRGSNAPGSGDYTYIGRCRCGFGPNAFYRNSRGDIIHANQTLQGQSSVQIQKINQDNRNSMAQNITPKTEYYRTCNKCGARVVEEALFCSECGNFLEDTSILPSKKERIDVLINRIKELKNEIKEIKKNYF